MNSDEEQGESQKPQRAPLRLITVGGGRGGVGKSLLAQNLAIYLAQLGKAVVLVDADATGANLHAHFGLSAAQREPSLDPNDVKSFQRALIPTSVPGLSLLPATHDSMETPSIQRPGRKGRWIAKVRTLPVEFVVIDVGPGHGHFALDVMLASDVGIVVTVPEPPAIEATYRFVRAAFVRRLRRALFRDRFRLPILQRALNDLGGLPGPLDLVRSVIRTDRALATMAWVEAHRMHLQLIVNQTRVRTDLELGTWMSGLSARHYGVPLDELGYIEHDDTVWLTVRRNKPLLIDSPTCKAARNLERIARRVVALLAARNEKGASPPTFPLEMPTLYAALGITRTSSDEEVRRAYKRQKEIYAQGGLATASLLSEDQLKAERARLDEAYDTLLDPVRRRAYDLSTFPDTDEPEALAARATRPALAAEQIMLQNELAREIGPETEFTGALLRKVRESQAIEIAEISARTKIAKAHLIAIEEENFGLLPAIVYVRGFVAELAKYLKLDPAQVQKTYLRRVREALAVSSGKGTG
ncbi:helix-turn-helix domain-containing protein [Pendulispora brunnea]|uniref:Helix-turn-helix domain-containing protein n=1 Tax=Pendulispora brunnea TaxID=2905690 RepID=A0ABZ2K8Y4_9BACT